MKVHEVSAISGLTPRTLRWYDKMGLVVPERMPKSGYRIYRTEHLRKLQDVVFLRELEFPLEEIKRIITDPHYNRQRALIRQLELLREKQARLETMVQTLELALAEEQGVYEMNDTERFKGFDLSRNPHDKEARERWGNEMVDSAEATIDKLGERGRQEMGEHMQRIFTELSSLRNTDPASRDAQDAIGRWFELLNRMGPYSLEMFANLGRMYTDDPRFTKNIDSYGEGLARFMREAMLVFSETNQ